MIPDPFIFMGMVFSIVVLLLVGGFVLAFPIARRLGGLMEEWIRDRKELRADRSELLQIRAELAELKGALEAYEGRFETAEERQAFMETLIESRPPAELTSSD